MISNFFSLFKSKVRIAAPKVVDGDASIQKIYNEGVFELNRNNYKLAETLFKKSANEGHISSMFNLGLMSKLGCLSYDYDKAIYYFSKASEKGYEKATWHLDYLISIKRKSEDINNMFSVMENMGHVNDGDLLFFVYFFFIKISSKDDIINFLKYELDCASIGNEIAVKYVNDICSEPKFYKGFSDIELSPTADLMSNILIQVFSFLSNQYDFDSLVVFRCNVIKYLYEKIM